MLQEKSDIHVDDRRPHLMKDENIGQWPEESEAETRLNARFWLTCNEEFDIWNCAQCLDSIGDKEGLNLGHL